MERQETIFKTKFISEKKALSEPKRSRFFWFKQDILEALEKLRSKPGKAFVLSPKIENGQLVSKDEIKRINDIIYLLFKKNDLPFVWNWIPHRQWFAFRHKNGNEIHVSNGNPAGIGRIPAKESGQCVYCKKLYAKGEIVTWIRRGKIKGKIHIECRKI